VSGLSPSGPQVVDGQAQDSDAWDFSKPEMASDLVALMEALGFGREGRHGRPQPHRHALPRRRQAPAQDRRPPARLRPQALHHRDQRATFIALRSGLRELLTRAIGDRSSIDRPNCTWFHLIASCRFHGGAVAHGRETAWLTGKLVFTALPRLATVSKTEIYCLSRQHNMPFCTGFNGSDGTRTRDLRRDRPAF
jgi:hypothetical protein